MYFPEGSGRDIKDLQYTTLSSLFVDQDIEGQKICQQLDWESMFSQYKLMTFFQKFRLCSRMWKGWIWKEFVE